MRGAIERRLRSEWTRRGALARCLWPLSLPYAAAVALRRHAYRAGWTRSARVPLPVIAVGNVVAGGAGKTPTTDLIVRHLRSRGWHPAIVSRGYGRRTTGVREVHPDADPGDVGDEPLLLRRRCRVPVVVAAQRAQAARWIVEHHPRVDVIVCDDALQHLALQRDIEIAVFDRSGVGNGWLLPAGPLREPWPRPVDFTVVTESADEVPGLACAPGHGRCYRGSRALAASALDALGRATPLSTLRGRAVAAVAGIARPEAFFEMLRGAGLHVAPSRCLALPDHASFDNRDALLALPSPLLCTEKDAAKLWRHRPDAMAVALELTLPGEFLTALEEQLGAVAARRQR